MKKAFKIIGVVLLTLLAIFLIPSLFFPGSFTAKSSASINTNAYTIFPLFGDLRNWELWSPWKEMDPSAEFTYSANTYGAGSFMEWTSDNSEVGHGKLTTVQFKKYKHIHYKLELYKPFPGTYSGMIEIGDASNDQVSITWTNTGKLGWPLLRWMNMMMDFKTNSEKTFDKGLEKLKTIAEAAPKKELPKIKPETINLKDILTFAIMRYDVPNDSIGSVIGASYMSIIHSIEISNAKRLEEPPICLFYSHNSKDSDIQPGLIVQGCMPVETEVQCRPLNGGLTLMVRYIGPYSNMETTYDAIDIYMEENNLEKRESYTWESYVTDPGLEPDSMKWITDIYIPIKGLAVSEEIQPVDTNSME